MHSKFQLYRAIPRLLASKTPNSNLAASARFIDVLRPFCNLHSTVAEPAGAADSPAEPELPGWVKFCGKKFTFFSDSDGDFGIPEIDEWAKNQKVGDFDEFGSNVSGIGMINDVERDVGKISRVLKSLFRSPDDVSKAISGCNGVRASEGLVMKLLARFNNDWIAAFGVFLWARTHSDFEISESVCNMVVDVLGKSRKFELLLLVVEEMHQLGAGLVTPITIHKVMKRMARAGQWLYVVEMYRSVGRFGIEKNVELLNMLIDVLVKDGGIEIAERAFEEFKHETPPNAITFNIFINGWCKAKKLDQAQKMLKEMEDHGLSPTVVSYTSFVDAYCREKNFSKVDELLVEMKEKGCPPNTVTFNVYITALGKNKEIRRALDVFERLKYDGYVPDAPLYSSLIYSLGKYGKLSDAEKLYENMLQHGVIPNLLTYNSMISMYCLQSRETEALKMLLDMENKNVKPDFMIFCPLLKMCCRKKQMKVLAFLLHHMFKNDVSPEAGTYTLLIHELSRSKVLEHACLFFEEMVLKGFPPMPITCEYLLKALQEEGMTESMEHIAELISVANRQGDQNC
ncbi:hypothetical protein QQ045_033354 [Rhodiola kirilowii]